MTDTWGRQEERSERWEEARTSLGHVSLRRPWDRHLDLGIMERAGRKVGIWGCELRRKKSNKSYGRIRGSCDARREVGREIYRSSLLASSPYSPSGFPHPVRPHSGGKAHKFGDLATAEKVRNSF